MSDTYGSGLSFTPGAAPGPLDVSQGADTQAPQLATEAGPPNAPQQPAAPQPQPSFGSSLRNMLPGAHYDAPDPQMSPLDQSANLLEQRVKRANSIATNPMAQIFAPEQVQAARDFVPKAAEELQKIQQQKSAIAAGRVQARTLGLDPGEVSDQASAEDRMTVAQAKALKGDMRAFQGIQAVAPERAAAIAPQVYETVASHLTKAQFAFDSLASMQNEGQYRAKVNQLRRDGSLADLESLGLKLPPTFEAFSNSKAMEGRALREARIGINTIGQKLEERNTYQPMEKKEAETYNGRLTTVYGDQVTNGTWGRNGATNTRGLVVNGAADPNNLGKTFTLATPDQRKAVKEEFDGALPKDEVEKYRAFNRTYELATKDAKGKDVPAGKINTNPNVQQGISEGLASMLRGGAGGANTGLLRIELDKRGWSQAAIDGLVTNYAGAMNTLFKDADKPYLSNQTQKQIRDVMDVLKTYNDSSVGTRVEQIAKRAGALGLNGSAFGLGKDEVSGVVGAAIEAGRREQIERMKPNHQAIGGGDGVLQLNAQRPGAGASPLPPGASPTNQLPGTQPLMTPVQQAGQPPAPGSPAPQPPGLPPGGSVRQPPSSGPASGPGGGGQPISIAGQQVSAPALPAGLSPGYLNKTQRIESGNERDPWKAGTPNSSAGGAFQFIKATWAADKPPGAPDNVKDATPQQQVDAAATRAHKEAASLTRNGLPVNDTTVYIAHNLGAGDAAALMQSDPKMEARRVVGETAARNNPLFFRGNPTVATVLQRYADAVNAPADEGGPKPKPSSGGATLAERVGGGIFAGVVPGGPALKALWNVLTDKQKDQVKDVAIDEAPALGSIGGSMIGGLLGNVPGGVAGGAAGGAAGQMLKDYLKGDAQNPREIAKQSALGGVLGVASEARPVLAAAGRIAGVGGVEAGDKAVQGGSGADITEAGLKGGALAAGGEMFGRALGMAGHKIHSMFSPDAQKAVQGAAKTYAEATETLNTEAPKLAGAGGAMTPNPKYQAAEAAKTKAEQTLKDAGLNPEEAAYAHKVSSEGVPKQEAQVGKPGALEQEQLGQGYQQIERGFGEKGVGAVKATPRQDPLPEGFKFTEGPSSRLPGRKNADPDAHEIQIVDSAGKPQARIEVMDNGNGRWNIGFIENLSHYYNGEKWVSKHPGLSPALYQKAAQYVEDRGGELFAGHQTNALSRRVLTKLEQQGSATPAGKAGERQVYKINPATGGPVLSDGPMAAVAGKKVSANHAELAEHVEMAITAPAKNWQEKWVQLKEARSDLLQAERDALSSTATARTKTANDMRVLADTVRTQQEKAAIHVFGPEKGRELMQTLKVLDARYRRLMEATNNGDLAKAAGLKGEAGRDADRKFRAFAHDDPTALAAWSAMRKQGPNIEKDVKDLVAAERIPVLGKVFSAAKLLGSLNSWLSSRAAGSPAKFSDFISQGDTSARTVRDVLGTVGARTAVQSDLGAVQ